MNGDVSEHCYGILVGVSTGYLPDEGKLLTRYAPLRRSPAEYCYSPLPLDLHVLSLPLAFILSQDQTLHCISLYKFLVRPDASQFHKELTLLDFLFSRYLLYLFPSSLFNDLFWFFPASASLSFDSRRSLPKGNSLPPVSNASHPSEKLPKNLISISFRSSSELFFKWGCKGKAFFWTCKLFFTFF